MKKFFIAISLAVSVTAQAVNYTVPGTANPWLAGMPVGSQDNLGTPEPPDSAPDQSPIGPISVTPGQILTWSATGQVGHPGNLADPDGKPLEIITSRSIGGNNNMSDIIAPICSLLGVFLGPNQPDSNPPMPATFDFSDPATRQYVSVAPELQQVFFMGDGLGIGGVQQGIFVPAGATRLYLGVMDGYGWANNFGSFEVTLPVPDGASSLALLSGAVALLAMFPRKYRK